MRCLSNHPLYITINHSRDIDFVKEKINLKRPSIVILKSLKDRYNIKTYRIANEMLNYGWEIRKIKHTKKKDPLKRNVVRIILCKQHKT